MNSKYTLRRVKLRLGHTCVINYTDMNSRRSLKKELILKKKKNIKKENRGIGRWILTVKNMLAIIGSKKLIFHISAPTGQVPVPFNF